MPRIGLGDLPGEEGEQAPVIQTKVVAKKETILMKPEVDEEPRSQTDEQLTKCTRRKMFSTFRAFPNNVHFQAQLEGEEIILLVRAHGVTNTPWIMTVLALVLIPVVVVPILGMFGGFVINPGYELLALVGWYLVTFSYGFLQFLQWFFNVGILTSERVVDLDWNGLLDTDIVAAQIGDIEESRANPVGVLASVFDYGNVVIETAGENPTIGFTYAPHPRLIVKKIEELQQINEKEHTAKNEP